MRRCRRSAGSHFKYTYKLVILADFDGMEKQCTVDELEASPNASFIRVISGNSLDDVQRILNRIERIAYEQANN